MISRDQILDKDTQNSVAFRITPERMAQFARLTGDRSSLHTDEAFARRAMYRRNVVYGMLPLAFIPLLEVCCLDGAIASLKSLSGRFIKPSFVGDELILEARHFAAESLTEVEYEYRVREKRSSAEITSGHFVLAYADSELVQRQFDGDGSASGLLAAPLDEAALQIGQITKGLQASFEFSISPSTVDLFWRVIDQGSGVKSALYFDAKNLLASLMYSTFVGMCMPGRYATFLNFSVQFGGTLPLDDNLVFRGTVKHVSKMTEIIAVDAAIHKAGEEDEKLARGKINSRVNPPPAAMPSMEAIKHATGSLNLDGKVVLVTGASRGIGETIAKAFAVHGAKVVVNYMQSDTAAQNVVSEINAGGGEALALQADVSDQAQVLAMVKAIEKTFGTVDILVNNAVRNFIAAPFLELAWDEFQQDLDVIVKGAFNCCQAVLPEMAARKAGKIINISTVAVQIPPANQSKYVTAKSGLVGLTRSLAVEFAPHNIQINLVAPDFVETDLTQGVPPMFRESLQKSNPSGRLASPIDVASAVLYLASPLAQFTTGQQIMVTGGSPPFS